MSVLSGPKFTDSGKPSVLICIVILVDYKLNNLELAQKNGVSNTTTKKCTVERFRGFMITATALISCCKVLS